MRPTPARRATSTTVVCAAPTVSCSSTRASTIRCRVSSCRRARSRCSYLRVISIDIMSIEKEPAPMHTVQTQQLELLPAHHRDDEANVVRAAWPLHHGTGSRSTAAVYFELERGKRLRRHTDH